MKQTNRSLNAVLILLTVILWGVLSPLHATAQSEEPYPLTAALADANGYRINKPFNLNLNLACTENPCPTQLVLQLGPDIDFVGVRAGSQLINTDLDFENQSVVFSFDPAESETQLNLEATLVIASLPLAQPTVQVGIPEENGVNWIGEVQLFAAENEPTAAPTTSKVPRESDLFLRSDFEFGEDHPLNLFLAPANRSSEQLDTLTLITQLPDGVYAAEIKPGWYTQMSSSDVRPSLEVSYQISDTWQTWALIDDLALTNQTAVPNPLLVPSEEDPEATISLFDTSTIKAIKFEYRSVPPHFRWGADRTSQPAIGLDIAPRLRADWVELCTTAEYEPAGGSNAEPLESCAASRTKQQVAQVQNFDFWITTNIQDQSPAPGDRLELTPKLVSSSLDNRPLDLIIDLPNWLEFSQVTNSLDYFPIVDGVPAEVAAQPIFEERISIETGDRRLHWRWPADRPLTDLSLPIIETKVLGGIPAGVQKIPVYLLSDGLNSCWNERPTGRDFRDIDRDENKNELLCQANISVGIRPIAGLAANLRMPNTIAPAIPFAAEFDMINGGNQPLTEINTAITMPKGWLVTPPIVPNGIAVAYSTSDNLCGGAADCAAAKWQATFPQADDDITAIKLSGTVSPILAGERATARLFLLPPGSSDITNDLNWASIIVSGASESGESVEFRYQPDPMVWAAEPESLTGGVVFEDINQNGLFEAGEAGIPDIPIALVSPGGDGQPATADDRILAWSRSNELGEYRFSYSLAGSYYLASLPTNNGYLPTTFNGDPETATDPITQFSPDTWRTDLIPLLAGSNEQTIYFGLNNEVKTTLSGVVAVDQNQNEQWDDALSDGQNGVTVELIDKSNTLIATTFTQTDGFGRPGRFLLQILDQIEPDEVSLRLSYATPFVGSPPSAQQPYQLELPVDGTQEFEVLLRELPQGFDTGDAPASYGISFHSLSPDLTIGLISDSDTTSTQTVSEVISEQQDDQTELDDEEGIFFKNGNQIASTAEEGEVVVVMRNRQDFAQNLNGWIDFNGDGFFEDSEKIVTNYQLYPRSNPQAQAFTYSVPSNAICGSTYARFRLGESDRPDGVDSTGEVEDLPFQIDCVTDLKIDLEPESTPIGPNELSRWFVYVSNEGQSPAENVSFNITIPGPFIYQGLVSLTNDPVACTDIDTARSSQTINCQIPELTSRQGITLSLSYFLPFDTEAKTISSVGTVSSDATDSNLDNNLVSKNIKVEKNWVLKNPTYEAFTHVSLFPGLVINPENREADFKQSTPIATVINVPISITIGVDTNRMPILTVQSCIDNPDDPSCNSTNFVEGQVIQESYTIERIYYADEVIFEPEDPETVRLNRISDPNMARCGALGSCVGFDLFRVGRGDVRPYAWNAPDDYFFLGFFTTGGRIVRCPEEGYDNRCYIHDDAKPGNYEIEGTANIKLVFQDTRLGPNPVEVDRVLQFKSVIRVVAPFVEPER